MSTRILSIPWLFAAVLTTWATTSQAEALVGTAALVRITPKLIEQVSAPVPPAKDSPYRLHRVDPPNDMFRDTPRNLEHIPNGCAKNGGSLCYDYRTGHAVYRPMRKLLPEIPGMTPQNISIRHHRIVAQYTFK